MAREGRAAAARRDLELASSVARAHPGATDSSLLDLLCRLGVLARIDVDAALKLCGEVPRAAVVGKKYATRAVRWLAEDPALDALRGAPVFKKLVAEFAPK